MTQPEVRWYVMHGHGDLPRHAHSTSNKHDGATPNAEHEGIDTLASLSEAILASHREGQAMDRNDYKRGLDASQLHAVRLVVEGTRSRIDGHCGTGDFYAAARTTANALATIIERNPEAFYEWAHNALAPRVVAGPVAAQYDEASERHAG